MGHSANQYYPSDSKPIVRLRGVALIAFVVGMIGIIAALIYAFTRGDSGWAEFGYAYLTNYAFFLVITLGSLAVVLLTTLFRAGWVVAVRRLFEVTASNMPVMLILALPILIVVLTKPGALYPWSLSGETIHARAEDGHHFLAEVENRFNGDHPAVYEGDMRLVDASVALGGEVSRPVVAMESDHPSAQYAEQVEVSKGQQYAHYLQLLDRFCGTEGIKRGWFNGYFFSARVIAYLLIWSFLGLFYFRKSLKQDETRDPKLTNVRERFAPLAVILFAATITIGMFDLVMSVDPAWYSTIFGAYMFANGMLAALSTKVLLTRWLKKRGALQTVTDEHFHDMGKLMFAFTFFWGYTAYAQYMLIWYASLPETTYWFELRGASTFIFAPQYGGAWTWLAGILLAGHLFVPFAFLLSKHVKRHPVALQIAAVWILLMVWLDMYWLVMPMYGLMHGDVTLPHFGIETVLCFVGIGGVVFAALFAKLSRVCPIAHGDPRMYESVALDTNVWAPLYHPPEQDDTKAVTP